MSRLKELTDYKNTILGRLLKNQSMCKAIYYQHQNFLEQPDFNSELTLYNNIYPYNYIPSDTDSVENAKTYITLSLNDFRSAGGAFFKAGYINVGVITHKDLFRTNYGYLRTDYIVSEIDEMLNDKRGIGIGKLEFVGMNEIVINQHYLGNTLRYRPVERG